MGAHFALPFAIITMDKIETLALDSLKSKLAFSPSLFVRFIDDVLVGPVDRDSDLPQKNP